MESSELIKDFVQYMKEAYKDRLLVCEEQWPPVRGDKLLNLQLVEADKTEGFRGGLPQHGTSDEIKQIPIFYDDLFRVDKGKKPVKKVLVEGNGGMGKTTLCTMLSEGWAEEKILTQFDCVLLLPLRDEAVSSAEYLSDLLALFHSDESICKAVVSHLKKTGGKGVLIIADGWDELEKSTRSKEAFLYKLLFGRALPFASVLLTSRPSASAPLHLLSSVDRLVEVIGFNAENIKQYIESEFEKFPEESSMLIKQLEKNPMLLSVCTVPLNCAITCNLWHTSHQELPSTLTELYTQIILNVILRDIQKKFPHFPIGLSLGKFDSIPSQLGTNWWLTCKFAFEALAKDRIVFTEEELASFFPESFLSSQHLFCFGLLQCANSLLPVGHGLSFHFLHLTFHEYLAALHLVTLPTEEQLEVIRTHGESDRFAMVWRFFFGLGSKKQGKHMSKKVVCIDNVVVDQFLSVLLRSNFFANLPQHILSHYSSGCELFLCHCAFESKDVIVSKTIAKKVGGKFFNMYSQTTSTVLDCAAIFHTLSHTSPCDCICVDLDNWGLGNKELTGLTDALSSRSEELQVVRLNLGYNKLTGNGVSDLFNRASAALSSLQEMNVQDNDIDGSCVSNIVASLELSSCKTLFELVLSDNHLGVSGIQALKRAMLAGVFTNLEVLKLANTLTVDADINSALLTTLMSSVATHCPCLETIEVSHNVLGIPGGCSLGEAFLQLTNDRPNLFLMSDDTGLCGRAINGIIDSMISSSERYNVCFQGIFPKNPRSVTIPRHGLFLNRNELGYDGLLAIYRLLRSNPF